MVHLYEIRHQQDYIGKLREKDGQCSEIVFYKGNRIHSAEFPASNLGSAKRSEYLNVMVSSVAREHSRKMAG